MEKLEDKNNKISIKIYLRDMKNIFNVLLFEIY